MKNAIRTALALIMTSISFAAHPLGWHDKLVSELIQSDFVDKTVVVERNKYSERIEKANYKFLIPNSELYYINLIRDALIQNSKKATKFSMEKGQILMQYYEAPQLYYTYQFTTEKNQSILLISVSKNLQPVSLIDGDKDFKRFSKNFSMLQVDCSFLDKLEFPNIDSPLGKNESFNIYGVYVGSNIYGVYVDSTR